MTRYRRLDRCNDHAYQGVDRRRVGPRGPTPDRTWIIAGVALGVLLVALHGVAVISDPEHLRVGVRSAGLVLGVVSAVASLLFWRTTGHAAGVSLSTAGWLLTLGFLIEILRPPDMVVAAAAAMLLAAVWVGRAITGPEVDTAVAPSRQALTAVVSVALLWGAGSAATALLGPSSRTVILGAHLVVALAWTVVAVIGFVRAVRGTCLLRAWAAWMALALALSVTTYGLGHVLDPDLLVVGSTLRLCALLVASIGAAVGIHLAASVRRDQLYDQAANHLVEDAQRDESDRERDHEIRNALMAIEGATQTLNRNRQRLDAEQRAHLDEIIRAGTRHLRLLVTDGCAEERPLQEVVRESVGFARLRGLDVDLNVGSQGGGGSDAPVEDRLLRQVLDNLLINVEVHGAQGGRARAWVEVEVDRGAAGDGSSLGRIRVRDDGAGIPDEEHEHVFARGYRLDDGRTGDGIGLHVARRLVRARGGDLVILPSASGASFEVRLPLGSETAPAGAGVKGQW
jgi:signal transduction histidine kinase